jgi:hypothetical protein
MPNKRDKNKKNVGAWVDEVLATRALTLARSKGISRSELIERLLYLTVIDHDIKNLVFHKKEPNRRNRKGSSV